MKGPRPKPDAVAWLLAHPDVLVESDETVAKRLIDAGLFSAKTYWRDIRILRLRAAVEEASGE